METTKIQAYKKLSDYLKSRADNANKNYLLDINPIEEQKKERFYDMVNCRFEFLSNDFLRKEIEKENIELKIKRKKQTNETFYPFMYHTEEYNGDFENINGKILTY